MRSAQNLIFKIVSVGLKCLQQFLPVILKTVISRVFPLDKNVEDGAPTLFAVTTIVSALRLPTNAQPNRDLLSSSIFANGMHFVLSVELVTVMDSSAGGNGDVVIYVGIGGAGIFSLFIDGER